MIEDIDRWREDDLQAMHDKHECDDFVDECTACGSLFCWECEPRGHGCEDEEESDGI